MYVNQVNTRHHLKQLAVDMRHAFLSEMAMVIERSLRAHVPYRSTGYGPPSTRIRLTPVTTTALSALSVV